MSDDNVPTNGAKPVKQIKLTKEQRLAGELTNAKGLIIELKKQLLEQEQVIAKLSSELINLECQQLVKENNKLVEEFGLVTGAGMKKDQNGDWWMIVPEKS